MSRLGIYFAGGASVVATLSAFTLAVAPPAQAQPNCTGDLAPGDNCVFGRVTGPVDVYASLDIPRGSAAKLGQLQAGDLVTVWGDCGDTFDQVRMDRRVSPQVLLRNKWCYIQGAPVPTGQGYIWGHLEPVQ